MRKRLAGVMRKAGQESDDLTVRWCFHCTRREWSDQACSLVVRWTLPDGTPLVVGEDRAEAA